MRYLSVCSGIEAASAAWVPLGWRAVAFSEIDAFPCAVLAHHYPAVPNWGDMRNFKDWPDAAVDVLCGGTPCASFSIAGLRGGLADPRGDLMLVFGAVAAKYRPQWVVWENVPGILSSDAGRDFGTFLGMLGELGYGFAYRVLDAQYVRVQSHPRVLPQRRRRVFVVGCAGGDWRSAAAVLFERASLQWNPAPRRQARHTAAGGAAGGADAGDGGMIVVAHGQANAEVTQDGSTPTLTCAHEVPLIAPVAFSWQGDGDQTRLGYDPGSGVTGSLHAGQTPAIEFGQIRRLTPRECERLMGFADDYTRIPFCGRPAADRPRYMALGNSWAVPVVIWIGQRIQLVDEIRRHAVREPEQAAPARPAQKIERRQQEQLALLA